MHANDTTFRNFSSRADNLMMEMAQILGGMTPAQADKVVELGGLLDFAARQFQVAVDPGSHVGELVARAQNHALAMRLHGATMRGSVGAALLEDLCDAVSGRYEPELPEPPVIKPDPAKPMSVDEAMVMLECQKQLDLANLLDVAPGTVTQWKLRGGLPIKVAKRVRGIYRNMRAIAEREAA